MSTQHRLAAHILGAVVAVHVFACSAAAPTPSSAPTPTPAPAASTCAPGQPLFSVPNALSSNHACRDWVWPLQGRVARSGNMSAAVWSLRTAATTGLLVSAVHTLGEGWLGPGGSDIPERLADPGKKPGATRIFLVSHDGGEPDELASVLFVLYHPEIPAAESGTHLQDILPRHDFFVGVIDSQLVQVEPLPQAPGPLRHDPPVILDPHDLTTTGPTYGAARPGDSVLLMGYPDAGDWAGQLAASVGTVLNEGKASGALSALAAAGDPEGSIPYDPEAEMILAAEATSGMSGGGVFDREGKLVGILVRASDPHQGQQYVRVVRMTYVVSQLQAAFNALHVSEKPRVGLYLDMLVPP